ncbi:MAG: HisA/HisF-related TIM barrel protein [Candidatus Hydrogenedentota bacterium]
MINLGKLKLKNPLVIASGTFGLGDEYKEYYSLAGMFVSKTITLKPRKGNPAPRIIETASGIVNSVGLENPGVVKFLEIIAKTEFPTIFLVSLYAEDCKEMRTLINYLKNSKKISGYELNISCPNIKHKNILPFVNKNYIKKILKTLRENTDSFISVKLPPYLCLEYVSICEDYGADAVSITNTYPAMVSINEKIIRGGLSGPCIKPLGLYNVYNVVLKTRLPVIASGGVTKAEDVIEYLRAGAKAVQIGSINFIYPDAVKRILKNIKNYHRR